MKNSKIHVDLDDAALRDFLSVAIVKNHLQQIENKKKIINIRPTPENAFEWSIQDCENDIAFYNRKLELLREMQAIDILFKRNGWAEHDVSDLTECDLECGGWMTFIGTKEEYDNLTKKLKNG